MATSTFSIRMDEDLKKEFDQLCTDFGMNMTTAVNIFARAVVRERRIPFEVASDRADINRKKGIDAFLNLRQEALLHGTAGMSLDEINDEISKSRRGE